jgi:hypothetical protein
LSCGLGLFPGNGRQSAAFEPRAIRDGRSWSSPIHFIRFTKGEKVMSFRTTVRGWRQYLKGNRPAKGPKRPLRRLEIEQLEDLMVLSTSIPLNPTTWTPLGPAPIINIVDLTVPPTFSGQITAIAPDPSNANTLYLTAAGGGVWKTTGAGTSWAPLTDNQPTLATGSLAVAPSNPNIIYAGTGEDDQLSDALAFGCGLLKSTDGGASWTLLQGIPVNTRIVKVVVDPTDANTVYVAVNGNAPGAGIWKSSDGGSSWTNATAKDPVNGGISATAAPIFSDLVINRSSPQILYAAIGADSNSALNGVYETTDGGQHWAPAGDFPIGTDRSGIHEGRIALALAPSDPQILYAAIAASDDSATPPQTVSNLLALYKSTDGGTSWNPAGKNISDYMSGAGNDFNVLVVDPSDSNRLVAGSSILTESTDGGATWTDIGLNSANADWPGFFVSALAFDAGGNLLVGTHSGITRMNNRNLQSPAWQDLNNNLQITQFNGVALDPDTPDLAYGVGPGPDVQLFTDSLQWGLSSNFTSDGTPEFIGGMGQVRVDFLNPNTVYSCVQATVLRSDDSGASFHEKSTGINAADPTTFSPPLVMDANNSQRLLFGTDKVYETTDRAEHWRVIGGPGSPGWNVPANTPIACLALDPNDANTIFAAVGSQIFVTHDHGATWAEQDIAGSPGPVSALTVSASTPTLVYAATSQIPGGTSGHIFLSQDNGLTWQDISNNLPDVSVRAVVSDDRDGSLYVGTDQGVYASNDPVGTDWVRFGQGLPNTAVTDLELDPFQNILAAGTYGRGMWEIQKFTNLSVLGNDLTATEGQNVPNVVATFGDPMNTNAGGTDPLGNYQATIDWNDGSAPVTASIQVDPSDPTLLDVVASHTYAEEGQYLPTVTVTDTDGSTGWDLAPVNVADAPLPAPSPVITATAAVPFSGTVATFTDADPGGTVADYTATISWADGTSSPGTVTADPTVAGQFDVSVSVSHTFLQTGPQAFTADIRDAGGSSTTVTGMADVSSLLVTGDPGVMGNVITLENAPTDPNSYEVLVNGQLRFTGLWSDVSGGITLNGDQTPYTFDIENIAQGVAVTLNTGTGDDTINVSPFAKSLDSFNGSLAVIGGAVIGDTLHISDSSSSSQTGRTYDLSTSALQIPELPAVSINYTPMANVVFDAGPRRNAINVASVAANATINAGPAGDTIAIGPSLDGIGLPLLVAKNTHVASGTLNVNANGGTLILNDQASQDDDEGLPAPGDTTTNVLYTSVPYTVSASEVDRSTQKTVTTITADPIDLTRLYRRHYTYDTQQFNYTAAVHYWNAGRLKIDGALVSAGTPFTVGSTAAGTPVTLKIGSPATVDLGAGSLDMLPGAIVVHGAGPTTAVSLNDQAGPTTATDVLTASTYSRANFGGLTYDTVGTLNVSVAPGVALGGYRSSQNVIVTGTAAGTKTTINAASGANNITVGLPTNPAINGIGLPGSPLDNVRGQLTLNTDYMDILTLWDWDSSTAQKTYAINTNSIAVTALNGAPVAHPVPISWQGRLSVAALYGSAAADTYQLLGQSGNMAALVVNGYYRANTFQSFLPQRTWAIYANQAIGSYVSGLGAIDLGEVWNFTGGPGGDTFTMARNYGQDGSLGGVLDGGGPGAWLDYSQNAGPVTVNLATGQATNIGGGIRHIQHVIGSRTADNTLTGNSLGNILIGGAGNNTLIAGSGNSILIGGSGSDHLVASSGTPGFDILIAGTTDFDSPTAVNQSVLEAMFSVWQHTTASNYASQVGQLRDNGVVVGGSTYRLNSATVHAHRPGVTAVLEGATASQAALDWFFALPEEMRNFKPGEIVTPIT